MPKLHSLNCPSSAPVTACWPLMRQPPTLQRVGNSVRDHLRAGDDGRSPSLRSRTEPGVSGRAGVLRPARTALAVGGIHGVPAVGPAPIVFEEHANLGGAHQRDGVPALGARKTLLPRRLPGSPPHTKRLEVYQMLTLFRRTGFSAIVLSLIATVSTSIAQVSDDPVQTGVASQALLHDWRSKRSPESRLRVSQMALALRLQERGISPTESIERIKSFRDSMRASSTPDYSQALGVALGAGAGAGIMDLLGSLLRIGAPYDSAARLALRTAGAAFTAYGVNEWFRGDSDVVINRVIGCLTADR